jgi:DNA-binding SARP family transcriptional activator
VAHGNDTGRVERDVIVGEQAPVVHLIGGPYISCSGVSQAVPEGSKKLLAFVALRRSPIRRAYVAGTLWPDGDDQRAAGNLRSALWRLRQAGIDVIRTDKLSLFLADSVQIDLELLDAWADRLIRGDIEPADLAMNRLPDGAYHLLPGWYDEWVIMRRERFRQRVLHALESLAYLLSERGQHAEAIDAAIRAVSEDPLRESAQRALLSAYLVQGNHREARLSYAAFARLLRRELGVEPSRQIKGLLGLGLEQWTSNRDAVSG